MGYMKHDAIIVTSAHLDDAELARKKAIGLKLEVTEIRTSQINGYTSFLIIPDGSKEGWEDSDLGEQRRDKWKRWTIKNNIWVDWVHVSFGGDEPRLTHVVDYFKK